MSGIQSNIKDMGKSFDKFKKQNKPAPVIDFNRATSPKVKHEKTNPKQPGAPGNKAF